MSEIIMFQDNELKLTQKPDVFCGLVYVIEWTYYDQSNKLTVYRTQMELLQSLQSQGIKKWQIYSVFELMFPDLRVKHIWEIFKKLAYVYDLEV